MSISVQIMFAFLVVTGCVVAPVALIWGWTRWTRQPKRLFLRLKDCAS